MPTEITYTQARANLAALCDEVTSTGEPIVIHRRGSEDVALVSAAELRPIETAHLLRSPKNAHRLVTALIRAAESRYPCRDGRDVTSGVRSWPRVMKRRDTSRSKRGGLSSGVPRGSPLLGRNGSSAQFSSGSSGPARSLW